ncbi:hypothetical protein GEV33_006876 [Tenebrio molitor]|uniref:Uncharacterized protein n=1 Tax=Tenebrio molitor TaxID=7067 RepID=A0A8J6LCW1_TENMO|nr:hypothetical protein GEV33_006876 [Tenebrio molitor]
MVADLESADELAARKCSIAGSSHRDARSVQLPGRLIAQRNKVQIFRRTRSATAERAAGAASRELRITCVAFGIRNHPCGWTAERHGAYRPALAAFGAVEEPEDLPYRFTVLPWSRNPSSSSEIEITVPYREGEPESPPSNYREATPFSGKGSFAGNIVC